MEVGELGHMEFKLVANAAQFTKDLDQAERIARRASSDITASMNGMSRSVSMSGASAGRSLLMLGQTIDDAQYGFRSIVNNIPTLVMAMGGGAGLAGAVGIAAVAVNQLVNHWDALKASMETGELWEKQGGNVKDWGHTVEESVGGAIKAFLDFTRVTKTLDILGFTGSSAALGKKVAAEQAAGAGALKDLTEHPVMGKEAEERAKLFKDAVKEFGGSAKLQQEVMERLQKAFPDIEASRLQGWAAQMIQGKMAGAPVGGGEFGAAFEKSYTKAMQAVEDKKQDKIARELTQRGAELERQTRDELRKEHGQKMQELEDRAHNMEVRREQLQQAIHDRPHYERFEGTKAMVDAMQSKALNDVPKAQLNELKAINLGIKNMHEEMVKERRNFARFS